MGRKGTVRSEGGEENLACLRNMEELKRQVDEGSLIGLLVIIKSCTS